MAQGVVIEQGTHTDLLTRNGAYARLVSAQSLERKTEEDVGGAAETLTDGESDDVDDPRQSSLAQVRTASSAAPSAGPSGMESKEDKESMGYSLIRCLLKLIREQPRLWFAYSVLFGTSLGAGKLRRRNMIEVSKLIQLKHRWHLACTSSPIFSDVWYIPVARAGSHQ